MAKRLLASPSKRSAHSMKPSRGSTSRTERRTRLPSRSTTPSMRARTGTADVSPRASRCCSAVAAVRELTRSPRTRVSAPATAFPALAARYDCVVSSPM
jgi:hypothetical protein